MRSIIIACLTLSVAAVGCSSSTPESGAASSAPPPVSPAGSTDGDTELDLPVGRWKAKSLTVYEDNENGFRISYPKNWEVQSETDECAQTVCFITPVKSTSEVSPGVAAVTVSDAFGSAETLQEAWNTLRNEIVGSFGVEAKTTSQGDTSWDGQEAKEGEYTLNWDSVPSKATQIMIYPDPTVYAFTGVGVDQDWKKAKKLYDQMIASFETT